MVRAFDRWKTRLQGSRDRLVNGLTQLVGRSADATYDEAAVEALLLGADLGVAVVDPLMARLRGLLDGSLPSGVTAKEWRLMDGTARQQAVLSLLKAALLEPLRSCHAPLVLEQHRPFVIVVVGVNGTGKTTSVAKLAARFRRQGRTVVLGAADTFRAAAIDQLRIWGDRLQVPVIAQTPGADPAAVAFDAVQAGVAKRADVVCIDTAGRLHTKSNLMEELGKVKRVIAKALPGAPHEVLLVIDATIGQNGLAQARRFHDALGLTGIMMAKLDGTAKGGIVVAIAQALKLPIRYVGVGEAEDDLIEFDPELFVEALLGKEGG